jgi:hypothetical protein
MKIKNIPQAKKAIFLTIILLALTACNLFTVDEPPGVGEKAEIGYAALDPIIKALEQYHTDTGTYPASLDELVLEYLSGVPTEVNDEPISYTKIGESYSLAFHYTGPGMNTCTYTPEEKWHCSGAY